MDSDSDLARFDPVHHGFELVLDIESSGLVATVTGRIETVDALIAMFLRVAAELRRTGLRQVLVIDHSFGVVPPEHQLRQLVASVGGQGFTDVRVAYVDARGTAISRMEGKRPPTSPRRRWLPSVWQQFPDVLVQGRR